MSEEKDIRKLRQEAAHKRWAVRLASWTENALLIEAFLLALSPPLATVALLAGIVLLIWRFRVDEGFFFRHLPLDVPVGLFVLLGAVSILVSPNRAFSFYNYYNLVGVYVLTYILAGQVLRTPQQLRRLAASLGAAACLVILYGFYQWLFGIDTAAMKWVDGDAFPELRKRVFSTWENPNILAGYLDIAICLALGFFVKSATRLQRTVLGAFMLCGAFCLAVTYARGACLVLAVVVAAYGILRDWRVLAVCVLLGALALVIDPLLYERLASVFTKVDTSMEMRQAFWESTVEMIQDHPFFGIGWGAYYLVYPEYDFYLQGAPVLIVHAHNLYLNYAAEIGLPGALAFCWFFFGALWLAWRARFSAPEPPAEEEPFALSEDGADGELAEVTRTVEATRELPRPSLAEEWHWDDWRLLSGFGLGLGLALATVALNGLTDDLLFNIPSSMLLWLLAAAAASLSLLAAGEAAEVEE